MTQQDFTTGIKQIEQIYGGYSNQHMLNKLENMTRFWTVDIWKRVIDRLITTRERQPKIPNFMKAHSEVREEFGNPSDIKRVQEDCSRCGGEGVLITIERSSKTFTEKDYTAVARCNCRNTENWSKCIPSAYEIDSEQWLKVCDVLRTPLSSALGDIDVKEASIPSKEDKVALEGSGKLSEGKDKELWDAIGDDDGKIPF